MNTYSGRLKHETPVIESMVASSVGEGRRSDSVDVRPCWKNVDDFVEEVMLTKGMEPLKEERR
jgi:hypothetical protein